MPYEKPVPAVDHLSAPFWAGCLAHELRLQTCLACRTRRFPPGPVCLECGSDQCEWIATDARARVYSWIVVRRPIPADVYAGDVPYVVALVEFDDGVRMPTNIVGCAPEAIEAGMEVEVAFLDVTDTLTLPQFRPVSLPGETRM